MLTNFHLIEMDGLPKKDGTYFVVLKNMIDGKHAIGVLPFCTSVAFATNFDDYDDGSIDHPGFIDEVHDDYGEYIGDTEVTDRVLAWGEPPSFLSNLYDPQQYESPLLPERSEIVSVKDKFFRTSLDA